jgi:hypothetical protein
MSDQEDDQRRDARLLKAMKTPPLSRDQLREELKRAKEAARDSKRLDVPRARH